MSAGRVVSRARTCQQYYLRSRTHSALGDDASVSRPVASPTDGAIVSIFRKVGGLHHRYERRAA